MSEPSLGTNRAQSFSVGTLVAAVVFTLVVAGLAIFIQRENPVLRP